VVQAWLDAGVSPAEVQGILSVVPYSGQLPSIAGDLEAMYELSQDATFQANKDDPAYMQRLASILAEDTPTYNQGLPPNGSFQPDEPLTFPPQFTTWGSGSIAPFYQQDARTLGRMLAEYGGDYEVGPRY
jgi:hypothetical protein